MNECRGLTLPTLMASVIGVFITMQAYADLYRGVTADVAPIISEVIPVVVETGDDNAAEPVDGQAVDAQVNVQAGTNSESSSSNSDPKSKTSGMQHAPHVSSSSTTIPATGSSTLQPTNAPPSQPKGPRFVCRGTRPFWTLQIEQNNMAFEVSGRGGAVRYSGPLATPSKNATNAVTNFTATGFDGSTLKALVVDARQNGGFACTDGASEQKYEYAVFVCRGTEVYDGCCWLER